MSTDIFSVGKIPYNVSPDDQFQVTIDISAWLGADTISSVAYSAVDEDGEPATATVLDAAKHLNTNTVLKPYIKGGGSGINYIVKCLALTANDDKKAFYVKFYCHEVAA